MLDTARGVADTGPPMELLPPAGIRWSDLPKALSQAGQHPEVMVAVSGNTVEGLDVMAFDLLTAEGFPGIVHATRTDGGIALQAAVGPYPQEVWSKARASLLVKQTHATLLQLGKVKRIPAYEAHGYKATSKPGARAK